MSSFQKILILGLMSFTSWGGARAESIPLTADLYELRNQDVQRIVLQANRQAMSLTRDQRSRETYQNKLITSWIEERNKNIIAELNQVSVSPSGSEGVVTSLTADQIRQTAASIEFSPATDSRKSLNERYNPAGDFGFCFLRAHYYASSAAARGLDPGSIKKIFMVGTMKLLGANWAPIAGWRYHVATAVRGTDRKWYMLDNHVGFFRGKHGYSKRVYTLEEWYTYYRRFMGTDEVLNPNVDGSGLSAHGIALLLYATDVGRIVPEGVPFNERTYYGVDKNGDGMIDASEASFRGLFKDVDNYLAVPISKCSTERYAPLAPTTKTCQQLTDLERQAMRARENLLNKWRLEVFDEEDRALLPVN